MKAGDDVVYLARRSWGLGRIRWVTPTGLLMCRFDDVVPVYEGELHPLELELAVKAAA